jgi:hypothetical protein
LAARPIQQAQAPSPVIEPLVLALQGSCRTENGEFVDLGQAMFLENRAIDLEEDSERRRLRIEGYTFYVDFPWRESPVTYYHHIHYLIDPGAPPDIELKFVYVEGVLALYWRETYQHRQYRQGLFHIEGADLSPWCEGTGGMTQED